MPPSGPVPPPQPVPPPGVIVDAGLPVASVTINHESRRNAFDADLLAEFVEAVESLAQRPQCRAVVIRAAGAHFCAGWDVTDFEVLRAADRASVTAGLMASYAMLDRLWRVPAVTVAAVRGTVAGFGVGLLTRLHLAIASPTTRVVLPEVRFGIAAGGVLVDLQRAMPAKTALDLLLSADPLDAARTLAVGLVSRIVPDDIVDAEALALASRIAGHPGTAVGTVLETFRQTEGMPVEAAVAHAAAAAASTLAGSIASGTDDCGTNGCGTNDGGTDGGGTDAGRP